MIECSDKITFYKKEYVEIHDIYTLSNNELESLKLSYNYSVHGFPSCMKHSLDDEEFRKNIKKYMPENIFATTIKVNDISILFFDMPIFAPEYDVSISKIDQLFDIKMSSFKITDSLNLDPLSEHDVPPYQNKFLLRDRFLRVFENVIINNEEIILSGDLTEIFNFYVNDELTFNERLNKFILDKRLEKIDKLQIIYSLNKAMINDNILDSYIGINGGGYWEISFNYKKKPISTLLSRDVYFSDYFKYISSVLDSYIEKILLEFKFNGFCWNEKYKTDEQLFCDEVIVKLLIKMNFSSVRFYHGIKEYGKDFIFSETDKFGHQIYYGLQVKAGDVSGKANSKMDEIIGQLDDAFSMPFEEIGSGNKHYISNFIIAISGNFTENAKDKIKNKIPRDKSGSVFFLDKEKIIHLAEKYCLL